MAIASAIVQYFAVGEASLTLVPRSLASGTGPVISGYLVLLSGVGDSSL